MGIYTYPVWRKTKVKCQMCDAEDVFENAETLPQVCQQCKRKALSVDSDELMPPSPELREVLGIYLQCKYPKYADYASQAKLVKFVKDHNLEAKDAVDFVNSADLFFQHIAAIDAAVPQALLDLFSAYDIAWLTKEFEISPKVAKESFRVYANILQGWIRDKARVYYAIEEDVAYIYNPTSGIYDANADGILNVLIAKVAPFCASASRDEIIKAVKAQNAYADSEGLETAPPYLIPCANGVLDARTFKLSPYSPDLGFKAKLEVPYNASATCPKIDNFIVEICSDGEGTSQDANMVRGLKQLAAYCLWRGYPIQKLFFLIGAGANGKGVFCAILQTMLGAINVSNTTLGKLCYDRFAAADLEGRMANIANELTVSEIKNFDMAKTLTSGTDRIRVERKNKQAYTTVLTAKLINASNKPPKSQDASDGFYRRLILFFFQRQFYGSAAKNGLEAELTTQSELSGFLNEALTELRLWLDEDGNFLPQATFCNDMPVDEIRQIYERASDTVAAFEYDACEFTSDPQDEISKQALYLAYRTYCMEKKLPPIGALQFKREFGERNAGKLQEAQPRRGDSRERVFVGLKVAQMEHVKAQSLSDFENNTSLTRVIKKNVFHLCQNKISDSITTSFSNQPDKQPVPSVPKNNSGFEPVPSVPAKKVIFLKDCPKWVSQEKVELGPFKAQDIAELPDSEALCVVQNKYAEFVAESANSTTLPQPVASGTECAPKQGEDGFSPSSPDISFGDEPK